MSYFAKLDENNIVLRINVLDDTDSSTEAEGITFLKSRNGQNTKWVQTYKDGTRKNYAVIGGTYDESRDAFISVKKYPSWVLDETTCVWKTPIDQPNVENVDGKRIAVEIWNEVTGTWDALTEDKSAYTWNISSNTYVAS